MLLLYTGLAIVVVVLGTGGQVGRLLDVRLHRVRLLFAGVGVHLLVSHWRPTGGFGRAVGFLLVLASIALLARFLVANLGLTNMSVVLVGLGLNTVCLLVNGGMPVALGSSPTGAERAAYEHSLTHHVQDGDDHLTFLADHLRLPGPNDTPISYGDLILAFGLIGVAYRVGADRRGAHAARPNAAPMIEVPIDEPLFPEPEPITILTGPPAVAMPTAAGDFAAVADFLTGVGAASAGPSDHDLSAVTAFLTGVETAWADVEAEAAAEAQAEVDAVMAALEAEAQLVAREVEPEPVAALEVDEEPMPALLIWDDPIPPLPDVLTGVDDLEPEVEPAMAAMSALATMAEPAAAPEPAIWRPTDRMAWPRPAWVRKPRRHRRLPRPIRPGRIGLHLFAPVPLDPEEMVSPWWGDPLGLDDDGFDDDAAAVVEREHADAQQP
jgi:hypothetical protein